MGWGGWGVVVATPTTCTSFAMALGTTCTGEIGKGLTSLSTGRLQSPDMPGICERGHPGPAGRKEPRRKKGKPQPKAHGSLPFRPFWPRRRHKVEDPLHDRTLVHAIHAQGQHRPACRHRAQLGCSRLRQLTSQAWHAAVMTISQLPAHAGETSNALSIPTGQGRQLPRGEGREGCALTQLLAAEVINVQEVVSLGRRVHILARIRAACRCHHQPAAAAAIATNGGRGSAACRYQLLHAARPEAPHAYSRHGTGDGGHLSEGLAVVETCARLSALQATCNGNESNS